MFDAINKHVSRNCSLTEAELQVFDSLLEFRTVKKKTFLLQAGEICTFEAYINKGCIRSYYIDEHGAEVVLQFGIEDWWVSDIGSFHEHMPSNMFIETLEDCELLLLHFDTKEQLLKKVPKLERVFRLMVQRNLTALQNRLMKTITMNGEEKYLDFMHRYPTISQRVPQHYVASFLGISPEFLSKVRGRLAKR
jgi:CRP/FNR family transcriptional regulator, cyclic AMP receptor protein